MRSAGTAAAGVRPVGYRAAVRRSRCLRGARRMCGGGCGPGRAGTGPRPGHRHRRRRWRRTRRTLVAADLERQQRPVGVADVDLLAVGMSAAGTRRPLRNIPLRLPLSMAIHRP